MPPNRRTTEALRLLVREQQAELESFSEADVLEFGSRREGFGDVAAIQRPPEAHVGRALRGHERMFAYLSVYAIGRRGHTQEVQSPIVFDFKRKTVTQAGDPALERKLRELRETQRRVKMTGPGKLETTQQK